MIKPHQAAVLVHDVHLTSERLFIRRSVQKDQSLMIRHESNAEIMRFILTIGSHQETVAGVNEMLQRWHGDEGVWVSLSVLLRPEYNDADEPIGFVFLNIVSYQKGIIEIGYRLHPDYHGSGYGVEAVKLFLQWLEAELQPNQCVAYCVCDNLPSWHLLEKLGFSRQKHILKGAEIDGTTYDEYFYVKLCDQ
ncbi:GNAT family N-acetyltransferase [Marinicella sp. W31]|uniref:GNAT family N-acetyltransferase n=1 Tax=Marinicella sp. W31 TaxID=3023713 RepID=UPI0037583E77